MRILAESMQRHQTPECKDAHSCTAAQASKAGRTQCDASSIVHVQSRASAPRRCCASRDTHRHVGKPLTAAATSTAGTSARAESQQELSAGPWDEHQITQTATAAQEAYAAPAPMYTTTLSHRLCLSTCCASVLQADALPPCSDRTAKHVHMHPDCCTSCRHMKSLDVRAGRCSVCYCPASIRLYPTPCCCLMIQNLSIATWPRPARTCCLWLLYCG
jgi:hypothetical protein